MVAVILEWVNFHRRSRSIILRRLQYPGIPLNYPANFTEKMNRILLNLYHRWPDMDNSIYIDDTCGRLMFCESENTEQEAKRLMAHIISLGFVEGDVVLGYFQFTVQGWKKIEEMLRQPKISVLEDKIGASVNSLFLSAFWDCAVCGRYLWSPFGNCLKGH